MAATPPDHGNPSSDTSDRLHAFAHDLKNRLATLWEAYRAAGTGQLSAEELDALAERGYFGSLQAVEKLMIDLEVPRGAAPGAFISIALDPLVEQVVQAEEYRWTKKQQTLHTRLESGITVQGDRDLLERLVSACLTNAIKFSPSGADITITTAQMGDTATITITDPGAGLTAKDLEHLFERYRILSSRATPGESQGRGTLARALRWAQAHGGSLTYASPGPGQGATCTITLPTAVV